MQITDQERKCAIKDFLYTTDFKGDSGKYNKSVEATLVEMANQRGATELKKRETKEKRKQKLDMLRIEKERSRKELIKQVENQSIYGHSQFNKFNSHQTYDEISKAIES